MAGFLGKIKGTIRGGAGAGRGDNPHGGYNSGYDANDPEGQRTMNQHTGGMYDRHPTSQAHHELRQATAEWMGAMDRGEHHAGPAYQKMKFMEQHVANTEKLHGESSMRANDPFNTPEQTKNNRDFIKQGKQQYHSVMEEGKKGLKDPLIPDHIWNS